MMGLLVVDAFGTTGDILEPIPDPSVGWKTTASEREYL